MACESLTKLKNNLRNAYVNPFRLKTRKLSNKRDVSVGRKIGDTRKSTVSSTYQETTSLPNSLPTTAQIKSHSLKS
jgi:hypothetical protein